MQEQSSTSIGPTCPSTTTCEPSRQHLHTHTQDFSVDLICGGFPCQDISVAGKGAGLAGERSGLWNDFARIIRTVRPRWVVIENVPALTARGLGTVLGDLAEIGFDAEWHCIPASAVGAPHRRERVWIVGNTRCEPIGGSIAASAVERGEAVAPASPVDTGDAGCGRTRSRSSNVAYAKCNGRATTRDGVQHSQASSYRQTDFVGSSRQVSSDSDSAGSQQQRRPEPTPAEQFAAECSGWWESEPDVGRVAHGVPSRMDRLRCLGNAVVPQVVEVIGRAILAAEARMTA
jgi:DNA (cytosine-5)-methyltransferase 1